MIEKFLNNRLVTLIIIPLILGSLTVFSYQPFNITFINFLLLPLFFYLIVFIKKKSLGIYRKKPFKKNLFIFGTFFGFGFYFSGLHWITNSLTFDDNFKILIPFALILIPLFLSLFMAFTILLIGPHLKLDFPSIALFSAGLAISDFLRTKIFTGFPWNLWAYSTVKFNEFLQLLNWIGLHSYNLIVITIFILPIIFFFNINTSKKTIFLIFTSFIIMSIFILGNYEINNNKL